MDKVNKKKNLQVSILSDSSFVSSSQDSSIPDHFFEGVKGMSILNSYSKRCCNHQEKIAKFKFESKKKVKMLCQKCAFILVMNNFKQVDCLLEENQIKKKGKLNSLYQKLFKLKEKLQFYQENFYSNLRSLLENKKKNLCLLDKFSEDMAVRIEQFQLFFKERIHESYNKEKKHLKQMLKQNQSKIKKSVKYIQDLEIHYRQIIFDLELKPFEKIIQEYKQKIKSSQKQFMDSNQTQTLGRKNYNFLFTKMKQFWKDLEEGINKNNVGGNEITSFYKQSYQEIIEKSIQSSVHWEAIQQRISFPDQKVCVEREDQDQQEIQQFFTDLRVRGKPNSDELPLWKKYSLQQKYKSQQKDSQLSNSLKEEQYSQNYGQEHSGSYFLNDNYNFEDKQKKSKKPNESVQNKSRVSPTDSNLFVKNPSCFKNKKKRECSKSKNHLLGSINKETLSLIETVSRSLNQKVRKRQKKLKNEKKNHFQFPNRSSKRFMKQEMECKSQNKNIYRTQLVTIAKNHNKKEQSSKIIKKLFRCNDFQFSLHNFDSFGQKLLTECVINFFMEIISLDSLNYFN